MNNKQRTISIEVGDEEMSDEEYASARLYYQSDDENEA